jgi:hypothetical protein
MIGIARHVRLFVVVFALAVLAFAVSWVSCGDPQDPDVVPSSSGTVVIQAANPYRFDVKLLIKCDWEWQKGKYRFYQLVVMPGRRQTLIRVPNDMRFCEVWPHVVLW